MAGNFGAVGSSVMVTAGPGPAPSSGQELPDCEPWRARISEVPRSLFNSLMAASRSTMAALNSDRNWKTREASESPSPPGLLREVGGEAKVVAMAAFGSDVRIDAPGVLSYASQANKPALTTMAAAHAILEINRLNSGEGEELRMTGGEKPPSST